MPKPIRGETFFVSENPEHPVASKHVLKWIANPDAGTEAETKTRQLMALPEGQRIPAAIQAGHDGYVVLHANGKSVVNHVFYEIKNGNELHVYSVHTAKKHEGKRFASKIVRELIEKMRVKYPRVKYLILGGGGEQHVISIANGLKTRPGNLKIEPAESRGTYGFKLRG